MKSLKQSNKGFTLVELSVTIVIFTILVSTAVFGLIQWQE
ncbi:MAG: prepilin-type N-terminal cleavage/methylation domain-containing protein, partial [Pseudobutyrivibrio sp.]|nr:prepilin-type N-terminal cleavage/methylation domain-containing protein [Pseudobutyrivibrio sp.]